MNNDIYAIHRGYQLEPGYQELLLPWTILDRIQWRNVIAAFKVSRGQITCYTTYTTTKHTTYLQRNNYIWVLNLRRIFCFSTEKLDYQTLFLTPTRFLMTIQLLNNTP